MSATTGKDVSVRERIAGAKSCLAILRELEKTVCPEPWSPEQDVWDAKRVEAITAFLEAAGPLTPRAAGAMSLLAEFVVGETQDGSTYFKDRWKPKLTTTTARRGQQARA